MLDICGKPMIQWVMDALDQAETIGRVVVIGLSADSHLKYSKEVAYLPDQGEMIDNIRAGVGKLLEMDPQPRRVMLVSSDVPAIAPESLNWVVNTAMQTEDDLYYTVIPRHVMESRYPTSRRSYVHLQDIEACGGDVNVIHSGLVQGDDAFWRKLVAARKSAVKQAALIGYDTLILLLLHRTTLDKAVKRVTNRLGLKGRAIVSPYAEIGMDVDKPHQLEIMRLDLSQRTLG